MQENDNMPEAVKLANKKADELLKQMEQAPVEAELNLVTFDEEVSAEELVSDDETILVTTSGESDGEEIDIEQDTLESEEVDEKPTYEELEELYRKGDARYKSIQGKYNKEGSRDREEIAYLKAQLAEQAISEPTSVQTEVTNNDDISYLSDSEKEAYDPEFITMMEKIARHSSEGNTHEVQKLRQQLQDKDNEQRQRQINTEFNEELSALAPNWSNIYEDELFQDWLDDTTLPYVGNARQALLRLDNQNDAFGVAEIFNAYQSLSKSTAKKGLKVPNAELSPPKARSSQNIESKPARNVYTQKFRKEFMKNYVTGQSMSHNGKALSKSDMDFVYKDIEAQMMNGTL